jgi:hypothetical protein
MFLRFLKILKGLAIFANGKFAPSLRGYFQKSLKNLQNLKNHDLSMLFKVLRSPEPFCKRVLVGGQGAKPPKKAP